MPRSRVRIFRNKSTRSTGLYPKLTFLSVLHYLGASGTVWLPYETRAKRAKLVQKFVPRCRDGIFRNEHTRSTPLDPKLTFCCVSYYLGAFGTAWLPYEIRCKTGRTWAKVRATKSRLTFRKDRTRSTSFDPTLKFWCIGDRLVELQILVQNGRNGAKVRATKSRRNFSQRTHPILPVGP